MNNVFFIILTVDNQISYFAVVATNKDRAKEKIKHKLLYTYANILNNMTLNTLEEVLWEIYGKVGITYSDVYTTNDFTQMLNEKIYN